MAKKSEKITFRLSKELKDEIKNRANSGFNGNISKYLKHWINQLVDFEAK